MAVSVSTFLLEIGTEELPADFACLVLNQLKDLAYRDLVEHRLEFGEIRCTSTPRRVVLLVNDLATEAKDFEEEKKGPPADKAFKNGLPTQAGIGFAKRLGLNPEELIIRETSKGEFVFARLFKKGLPTKDLLVKLIPEWISSLQGRRFMRWGNGERRFSRPIRWLVSLIDDQLISVHLTNSDPEIKSGFLSKGHRLVEQSVKIPSASFYFKTLKDVGVEVDRSERSASISELVNKAANELNARPDLPDYLLEELTDLVESPSLLLGNIDEDFLKLPAEVLSTVMRVHQRYVPLYQIDATNDPLALEATKSLLPHFLCISNGLKKSKKNITRGNERVLKARLADAEFFVNFDLSISSDKRREKLANVTFSEGLGSLLDRVERMKWISTLLSSHLSLSAPLSNTFLRATHFCKNDLVSQMVGEFPELQGVIGGKYLLAEGESRDVSLAVMEHYLPKGSNDNLPKSEAGCLLALTERIELLLSIYSKGERPSGSSDPYALRRAANGIIQILFARSWTLNLNRLLDKSIEHWIYLFPKFNIDKKHVHNDLSELFRFRIINNLEELGIDFDISQSVAGDTVTLDKVLVDPLDTLIRARLLSTLRNNGDLSSLQAVVTRAARLAEKGDLPRDVFSASDVVNSELFEKESEHQMLNVINNLEPIVNSFSDDKYLELANGLVAGSKALSAFFDGEQSVMVMTKEELVRNNRLNLLAILRNQASVLADFNQIVNS